LVFHNSFTNLLNYFKKGFNRQQFKDGPIVIEDNELGMYPNSVHLYT